MLSSDLKSLQLIVVFSHSGIKQETTTAKTNKKEEVAAGKVSVDVAVVAALVSVVNFVLKGEQRTTLEAVFTFTFDGRRNLKFEGY